jgi:hypothetical protein
VCPQPTPPPIPSWQLPPRLEPARELPPYRYIPGQGRHPVAHPKGHSFGKAESIDALTLENWVRHPQYRFGFDLFNHAYWWEAHETWEGVWHATADESLRLLLQILIQTAALHLQAHRGRPRGVRAFAERIAGKLDMLRALRPAETNLAGVDIDDLTERVRLAGRRAEEISGPAELSAFFRTLVPK